MQRAQVATGIQYFARIALILGLLLRSTAARATDPGAAPVTVVLHSESAELGFDALAQALSEELGAPAIAADSPESSARMVERGSNVG
jgi:hypothetical protein